jgi:predicted MPP superfamily phosphohydrolase
MPQRRTAPVVFRIVIYFAAAWGIVAALASGLFPGAPFIVLGIGAYTTIPVLVFARWSGWPFYPGAAFRLFVVRPFWYTQILLPLVSGSGLIGIAIGLAFGYPILVGRIFAGSTFAVAAIVLLIGYVGSRRLVTRQVEFDVPNLPESFDGLRIVQLSDLHVGPHTPRRFLERVMRATRGLAPDLIAVTGDLVDDRAEDVDAYAKIFGALDAPLGVYIIPGNHDVYAGWDAVERALRAEGLGTVLVNESTLLRRGLDTIALVGTGDPAAGRRGTSRAAPDVGRALEDVPSNVTVIAFAHNPALWPSLAARGVSLTLSGHTHWGQFALPNLGWSLASPFLEHAMAAHVERDALLYISPGTGYWGIPFRIGARPEVTLLTLRHAATAGAHVHPAGVA